MTRPDWAPSDVDIDHPSIARIYDYNLGGSHNFAVDRAVAEKINAAMPQLPAMNRANRSFLRRAVRYLAEAGVRQYLDLGSGIPTVGNVHQVAHMTAPQSRVAYVDVDPVAVAHSRSLLDGNDYATAIRSDIRQPDVVLNDPSVRRLLDFSEPMAVLMVAVLQFVTDDQDPYGTVARYMDATVPGSYLVISHPTYEGTQGDEASAVTEVISRALSDLTLRGRKDIERFFDGYDLVEPGLVYTPEWHPESPDPGGDQFGDHPERAATLAAVGRKR